MIHYFINYSKTLKHQDEYQINGEVAKAAKDGSEHKAHFIMYNIRISDKTISTEAKEVLWQRNRGLQVNNSH